jgi:hypothetical protein
MANLVVTASLELAAKSYFGLKLNDASLCNIKDPK